MNQLLSYVPPVLWDVLEFQLLTEAAQVASDRLSKETGSLLGSSFFDDADEVGVQRYETLLGLLPRTGDTLETRRFRVKAKFNEQLPFTYRTLEQQLTALCGADGFTLELNGNQFLLAVQVDLLAKQNFQSVAELLERVVPANLRIDLRLRTNIPATMRVSGALQFGKIMTVRQV